MTGAIAPGSASRVIKDCNASHDQLAVVEKYEQFIAYLYPILQNAPRKHGVARDSVIRAKRKIARFHAAHDYESLQRFLASWLGHAGWADAHHLLTSLGLEDSYDHQYPSRP